MLVIKQLKLMQLFDLNLKIFAANFFIQKLLTENVNNLGRVFTSFSFIRKNLLIFLLP